jgi:hypothetical protein
VIGLFEGLWRDLRVTETALASLLTLSTEVLSEYPCDPSNPMVIHRPGVGEMANNN